MLFKSVILILFALALTSCALFQPSPKPCSCPQVEADLYRYTADYATCLEDLGIARQQRPR